MDIIYKQDLINILKILEENKNILIVSHRGPDGDTLGSNLALAESLKTQWSKNVVSACFDEIPESYCFLKNYNTFVTEFDINNFDLIVTVDIATERLFQFEEKYPGILNSNTQIINIDHHHDNTNFGTYNLVYTEASTTIIIYYLLLEGNFDINIDIATYLLTGVYYDTGSLMHSNTDSSVYRICSALISKGANFQMISKYLFNTIPYNRLRLWGKILERIHMNEENIVIADVNDQDFRATNTNNDDVSGVVDYLNMVIGAKYCILLNENTKKNLVKGSLRTLHDDIDVSCVAHKFGGGGHKKASGFALNGKLVKEIRWKVVNDV